MKGTPHGGRRHTEYSCDVRVRTIEAAEFASDLHLVGIEGRRPASALGGGTHALALDDAGLERMTIHDLRHTAASLAIASGANVKAVQRMLGHASAAMMLDVYADLFDDVDVVSDALDRARAAAVVAQ